jgi:putative ABC transport system ATP-binding protein
MAVSPSGFHIHIRNLVKRRAAGASVFELHVPQLTISSGETVVLKGVSGSGKSTLLDILAMALRPDTSQTFELTLPGHAGADVAALWQRGAIDRISSLRGRHIGYVLQTGGLLPFLTVRENIGLPGRLYRRDSSADIQHLSERLGIAHLLAKQPAQLSVGERQRVAIARALAHRPDIVLADEPTASVDPVNADIIFQLFLELVQQLGSAAVIASHDWQRLEKNSGYRILQHHIEQDGTVTRSSFWNDSNPG